MKRMMVLVAGYLALAAGAVGIVIPVLPTTPFVIIAATCFSLSSPALARKLEANRMFGPYLAHWRTRQGIPRSVKIRALAMLWIGLSVSAVLLRTPLVWIVLAVVGTVVTLHILLIKTKDGKACETLETT